MFQSDADLFFSFLKEVCSLHSQGYRLVEIEDLISFFREKILTEEITSKISLEGFSCIQSLFILMNENQRKLCRLNVETTSTVGTYPEKKFTSYSN